MKNNKLLYERKSITIPDEDRSLTILKPFSLENEGEFHMIYEDAYGDFEYCMLTKDKIALKYNLPIETIENAIEKLM
ncbi:MAG: hypothetical protein ACOC33_02780 [bacterium]